MKQVQISRAARGLRGKRSLVLAQLASYLFVTLSPGWAMAVGRDEPVDDHLSSWAHPDGDRPSAQTQNGSDLAGLASQYASGALSGALADYLSRFGTTRLDLDIDQHFRLRGGSLDLLLPLSDQKRRLDFAQAGIRRIDRRTTLNLGAGQRFYRKDWMLGYNGFLDLDLGRGHRRAGLGVEAWRDNLKLAINGYGRLSGWKASALVRDFDERPANGFDVRVDGYLPSYPALGGRLMYEHYNGAQVDLFSRATRSRSPGALTFGVNYTPVPMLTFSIDHRRGAGQSDTRYGLQLNLQFDRPLGEQLDPHRVAERRSLAGSRYDLVGRNNRIVMEYREQQLLKIALPAESRGLGKQTLPLDVAVESKYPLKEVVWQQDALLAAGGKIKNLGGFRYELVLPAFNVGVENVYNVTATAYDVQGHRSQPATMRVQVTGVDVSTDKSHVEVTPNVIAANGMATAVLRVTLRNQAGEAVTGMAGQLSGALDEVPAAASRDLAGKSATLSTFSEVSEGTYEATITAGTRPATLHVTPSVANVALPRQDVQEVADAGAGVLSLSVDADGAVADGVARNRVTATLVDKSGQPVKGAAVTFGLSGSATAAPGQALEQATNDKGLVSLELVDAVAEVVTVTAKAVHGVGASTKLSFVSGSVVPHIDPRDLKVDRTTMVANGRDQATYTATVKDEKGKPVANVDVAWSTSSDMGSLSSSSSTTNGNGVAQVVLTAGDRAGIAVVTAKLNGQPPVTAPDVRMTVDFDRVRLDVDIADNHLGSMIGNDHDVVPMVATLKDVTGAPVADQVISWSSSKGGSFSASETSTDSEGRATTAFHVTNYSPSNFNTRVTGTFRDQVRGPSFTVHPVQQAGGRDYWVLTKGDAGSESDAIAACAKAGDGTVAGLDDLAAFKAGSGDFARMKAGEYADNWYHLRGEWNEVAGDFHSGVSNGGVPGDTSTTATAVGYVCVR